jgi:biopolymer transport protein ExbD
MSEISTDSGGKVKGKPKKLSTRVDFTPMVDLMFLLLTFFMLATSMIKPQTMEIVMPAKPEPGDPEPPKVNNAITILMDKDNKLYYYSGTRDNKTGKDPDLLSTDYSPKGIRSILLEKNKRVVDQIRAYKVANKNKDLPDSTYRKGITKIKAEEKNAPVILIKATKESTYANLVNILDEMQICSIGRYAIVDINDYDLGLLKKLNL